MRPRGQTVLGGILSAAWALTLVASAPVEQEPAYDTATVIDVMARVTEIRQVPPSEVLGGVHLLVRTERESLDVYLGPADFIKEFSVTFSRGDRVQVIGSRVKHGSATIVLAREVRKGSGTLYLRNRGGEPNWIDSDSST